MFMNLNLAYNSIGFYQMSKLLCIPTTIAVESMIGIKNQDMTYAMIASLVMIMAGVSLFIVKDLDFRSHVLGYMWAIAAVLATSLAQVFFGPLQKALDLNPLQLMYHTSPLLTLGSFVFIPLFEDRQALFETNLSMQLTFNLFVSCIGAVLLNLTNYFVLSHTTPLSYLVLGHIKTILILILGYAFFDQQVPSSSILMGILVALFGVGLFSWEKTRQKAERQTRTQQAQKLLQSQDVDNKSVEII
jgi:solute carrier family 35, member E3